MENTSHGLTEQEVPHMEKSPCGRVLPEDGGALHRVCQQLKRTVYNTSYGIFVSESAHMEHLAQIHGLTEKGHTLSNGPGSEFLCRTRQAHMDQKVDVITSRRGKVLCASKRPRPVARSLPVCAPTRLMEVRTVRKAVFKERVIKQLTQ